MTPKGKKIIEKSLSQLHSANIVADDGDRIKYDDLFVTVSCPAGDYSLVKERLRREKLLYIDDSILGALPSRNAEGFKMTFGTGDVVKPLLKEIGNRYGDNHTTYIDFIDLNARPVVAIQDTI